MSEKSLKERFQEKLDGSRWIGSTNNIGYPKMKVDGEMVLGSHVALQLAGRKVPTGGPAGGKIVMHKDNNKLNLSPSNLAVGTHKENLKQMRDEGRDRPRGVHQEPDEKTAGPKEIAELVALGLAPGIIGGIAGGIKGRSAGAALHACATLDACGTSNEPLPWQS